jgi:hypothetical protein
MTTGEGRQYFDLSLSSGFPERGREVKRQPQCSPRGSTARGWESVLRQTFEVQLDGLANQPADFFLGLARRDASRQVRDVGREVRAGVFDHDRIPLHRCIPPSVIPAGLLADARQRPRRERVARLARDRDPAGPGRVFELAVAALGLDSHPAVRTQPA